MSLTVDLTGKIVSVTATGDFSVSDIRGAFTEIRSARMDLNPVLILVDDQSSRFLPGMQAVEEFVAVWSTIFKGRPVRIALLVEREVHFGIGRQAMVFAEQSGLDFSVFQDRAAAHKWLSGTEQ